MRRNQPSILDLKRGTPAAAQYPCVPRLAVRRHSDSSTKATVNLLEEEATALRRMAFAEACDIATLPIGGHSECNAGGTREYDADAPTADIRGRFQSWATSVRQLREQRSRGSDCKWM